LIDPSDSRSGVAVVEGTAVAEGTIADAGAGYPVSLLSWDTEEAGAGVAFEAGDPVDPGVTQAAVMRKTSMSVKKTYRIFINLLGYRGGIKMPGDRFSGGRQGAGFPWQYLRGMVLPGSHQYPGLKHPGSTGETPIKETKLQAGSLRTGPVLTLMRRSLIPASGPERPPYHDRVHGAEIVAQKTHAAKFAFFRVNAISFYPDKYAHRA
jgi:hypothetical protein